MAGHLTAAHSPHHLPLRIPFLLARMSGYSRRTCPDVMHANVTCPSHSDDPYWLGIIKTIPPDLAQDQDLQDLFPEFLDSWNTLATTLPPLNPNETECPDHKGFSSHIPPYSCSYLAAVDNWKISKRCRIVNARTLEGKCHKKGGHHHEWIIIRT